MWQVEEERGWGRGGKQDASVVGGMMHDELERTTKHVGTHHSTTAAGRGDMEIALRLFARLQHLVTARHSLNAINSKIPFTTLLSQIQTFRH